MKDIQQPVMRQGLLWIVEPPLSTGERMSENGQERKFAKFPQSGQPGLEFQFGPKGPANLTG